MLNIGFTESLSKEVGCFNIRTLLVDPGSMATDFVDPAGSGVNVLISEPYKDTPADKVLQMVTNAELVKAHGANPQLAAARIIEAVDGTGMLTGRELGLRLPLGRDTQQIIDWGNNLVKEIEGLQDIARSIHDE